MMWWEAAEPQVLFAPLAEFTDAPMRRMASEFGADFCFSEMVNARGLSDGGHASYRLLTTFEEGERVPCFAQLYGSVPEEFGLAAERAEALGGFAGIDINVGCPMPRIRACGAGAALIEKPALVGEIVAAVRRHSRLPVTIKTRLGPMPGNVMAPEVLRAARDGGAAACTVHARYTSQILSGPIDVATLASVVEEGILPVAANGAIRSGGDALRLLRESGAHSVMVGWGAIGNPWLVRAVCESVRRGEAVEREMPTLEEAKAVMFRHMEWSRQYHARQRELYPDVRGGLSVDEQVAMDFRTSFFRYFKGFPGSNRFRAKLTTLTTAEAVMAAVEEAF